MILSQSSKYLILFTSILVLLSSCAKEYEPEPSTSDLKFFNYGEDNYVTSVHVLDDRNSLTSLNQNQLMLLEGDDAKQKWVGNVGLRHLGACQLKGRGYLQISGYLDQSLSYSVYNNNGELEFDLGQTDRIFPEYSQYREILASVQSDGNGGAYLLVVLADEYSELFRNYIVHINNQNQVDRKVRLLGFFRYMTVDDGGNIFLIRTYGAAGQNMKFFVSSLKMNVFNEEERIEFNWQRIYQTPEVDWKWIEYFPYQFYWYDGSLFFVTTQFPDFGDICSGVDIYEISPSDGSEIRKMSAQFEFLVDNYKNRPLYYLFVGNEGMYLAMNYLAKSKVSVFDRKGELQKEIPVTSPTNRAGISGIGPTGDKIMIQGWSTLSKSVELHPMLFLTDRL